MKSFKQYLEEQKIRAYHGSLKKWEWNPDDLPKNKFQRTHFSSPKKDEASKYGHHIHVQDIDTSEYKSIEYDPKKHGVKSKTINRAIRAGHKGIIFKNHPDKSGDFNNLHDEIITFDHTTINKIGYSK